MPQENSTSSAADVRQLFSEVLNDNEKLKVRVGQTVVFNDSNVGKPRDRLDAEMLSRIRESVFLDQGDHVNIPLAPKGGPKAPEIEVVGISGKRKEGERILFRQEKGLGISVNEVGDLLRQRVEAKIQQTQPEKTETFQEDLSIEDSQPETTQPETSATTKNVSTAVDVFAERADALPQSQTKALWKRLSADFQALSQQLKEVSQKNKEIVTRF